MPGEVPRRGPLSRAWFLYKERLAAGAWVPRVVMPHDFAQRFAMLLAQVVRHSPEGHMCQPTRYYTIVVGIAIVVGPASDDGVDVGEDIIMGAWE